MLKKIITVATLCALSLTAAADFKTVTRAYEVRLSNFRLPITPNSSLGMRKCVECPMQALRVTSDTRYTVNGAAVDLKEFRRVVLQARKKDRADLVVQHHLASDTVTLVAVSLPHTD